MANKQLPARLKESLESTKVEYRQLGKSGLRVSVPIFGCMSFGDPRTIPWALGEDDVRAMQNQLRGQVVLTGAFRRSRCSRLPTIEASTLGIQPTCTPTVLPRSPLARRSRSTTSPGRRSLF